MRFESAIKYSAIRNPQSAIEYSAIEYSVFDYLIGRSTSN
jgi:hypothetical protein